MPDAAKKIRLLDPHTINQIAAGEVVERPASIVKELTENALDAGATRVEVDLEQSGRKLIRVADDGCGMTLEDAQLALQRHATSKIASAGDLFKVVSLGFRGEALPSIASVSHMTVSTGNVEGLRNVLVIDGGKPSPPAAGSGPRGTEIRVEDLFFNTPARLKFLKTDPTELSAAVEVLSKYAIAYPNVSFRLRHGGNVLVETTGSGDTLVALSEVWGRDVAKALAPVDLFNGEVRVRGYVSPPHFTRPTRAFQWFYANGRAVRSKAVTAALDQAYRSLTPERRHPVALLMLEIDPAKLDVNVSPTKSEVRFLNEGAAFDAIRRGVKGALLDHGMIPSVEGVSAANEALRQVGALPAQAPLMDVGAFGRWAPHAAAQAPLAMPNPEPDRDPVPMESARLPDMMEGLRVLAQLERTYILAENRYGLMIVDQHVAHERIIYEQLLQSRGATPVQRQPLLTPETVHVDRRTAEAVGERLDDLRQVGFELEPFGGESFLVRSVPASLRTKHPIKALRDLLEELADGTTPGGLVPTRDKVFILSACKMAVKAGDTLSHAEMEKLLADLAKTENPYLCPHGRPIAIVMSKEELLRRFKRA